MSALANIYLSKIINVMTGTTSSATVAYDSTFAPAGLSAPNVNRWVDRSGGIQALYPRYDLQVRDPVNGSPNMKIVEKLVLPIANINSPSGGSGIQPLPSVGYNLISTREITIPAVALAADKVAFYALLCSLMTDEIQANDGSPIQASGTPLKAAVLYGEKPY